MKEPIEIRVAKQRDGYTFAILPDTREQILAEVPNACPANRLSVMYPRRLETDFSTYYEAVESHVLLAILGVKSMEELKPLEIINFRESITDTVLHQITFPHV